MEDQGDVWRKKYIVIKRKCDELEKVNECLYKRLLKIQKLIEETEYEKDFISRRLERYNKPGKTRTKTKSHSKQTSQTCPHSNSGVNPPVSATPPPPLVHAQNLSLSPRGEDNESDISIN